jgi:hypothetical protein
MVETAGFGFGFAFDLALARFGMAGAGGTSAAAPIPSRGDRAVVAFALAAFAILTLPPKHHSSRTLPRTFLSSHGAGGNRNLVVSRQIAG